MSVSKKMLFGVLSAIIIVLFSVAFCVVSMTTSEVCFAGSEEIILHSAEKPLTVLLPANASEGEIEAARTFTGYAERITGVLPASIETNIDSYLDEHQGNFVVLRLIDGDVPYGSFLLRAGKDKDGAAIADKTLYIEGYDLRGLNNGIYTYLREFCGVNIYSKDVKVVPEAPDMRVKGGYYLFYKPLLEYADTDWISPHDAEFSVANGLNGVYSPIGAEQGGKINYVTFCHSLTTSIVPSSVHFADHPEYYALTKKGVREDKQLCLSNPDVIEQAKKDVLSLIEEKYDPASCLNIISVTQDDNQDYCLCENCTALAEEYGGQSGIMIWFVNQIADAVASSAHPDVLVDTFAYQYTRKVAKGIAPRENVCVRLCSIECCFAHALDDETCEKNVDFMKDLDDWSKICSRLYIWDYTTNYAQTLGIFPDFGVIKKNIDVFTSHNVVGIYEEGAYYAANCDVEFADLRAYLLARYMLDPLNTYGLNEGIFEGFLKAYYGEGWEEVGKFLEYITEHAGDNDGHLFIYVPMTRTLHNVTEKDVAMLDALWNEAERKATEANNAPALEKIRRSRFSWEYYKACCELGEYEQNFNIVGWTDANAALIAQLDEFNVTQYCEGSSMAKRSPSKWTTPAEWGAQDAVALFAAHGIWTIVLFVLALLTAAIVILRKKHLLLVVPISVVLCCFAGFGCRVTAAHSWQIAPFLVVLALMTLLLGVNVPAVVYALKGNEKTSKKTLLFSYLIGTVALAVVFAAFLCGLFFAVYGNSLKSAYTASFCLYQAFMTVCLCIVDVKILVKRN